MPVKYSKSSSVDTSPDPKKIEWALLEEVRKGDNIAVYPLSGA